MAATRFGIDGGIAPAGLTPVVASIGLATESDSARPVGDLFSETTVTRFGLDGGIQNGSRLFQNKLRFMGKADEADTALAVVDPNDVLFVTGQATESDAARAVTAGEAATITLVSSIRGTNIITANSSLTVQVGNSAGVTSITVNGVVCTLVTILTPTEITCNVPLGVGTAYSANTDVVAINGFGSSAAFPALWEPPLGMVETDFTVDYAGLDPDSPFAGDTDFSALSAGPPADSCIYSAVTTPDSLGVSMDGLGEFTITGTITQIQTFDYYIYDASDDTVSATIEQITVQPGPVEVLTGQASEADSSFGVTSLNVITQLVGIATESDSAFAVVDGSGIVGIVGLASEADSALAVSAQGPSQTVAIGLASEADSGLPMIEDSVPAGLINQVSEGDFAFPMLDGAATRYTITRASEVDFAQDVDFPADLDSIREQIELLQTTILAQQQQIFDLYTRFDLDPVASNTYRIDGVTIVNDNFTLTKTDNLDGTFTIDKTITEP